MPRFKNAFKKKGNTFSGTRNPGGKPTVSNPRPTDSTSNASATSLGLGSPDFQPDSSSKKKVSVHLDEYGNYEGGCGFDAGPNDIVNLGRFEILLSSIGVCVKCKGSLSIFTSYRQGLSVKLSIKCNSCKYEVSQYNSSREWQGKSEVNVRLAYAFRSIGKGEQAAQTVCALMNLPSPAEFRNYNSVLANAAKEVCEDSMKQAIQETMEENEGEKDITAIFDGSWQKRGHSSLNGFVSAISGVNGKVIDVKILSKLCICKNRLQQEHEAGCTANYQGASGGMEVQGVLEMFRESEAKYGVRYKYYLGDGDSASYSTVANAQPYGPDFTIEKKSA